VSSSKSFHRCIKKDASELMLKSDIVQAFGGSAKSTDDAQEEY